MKLRRVLTPTWLFLLLIITSYAAAQPTRRNFTRPQTFDVEHYDIRVNFDRPAKKVIGETTITFKPLKDGLKTAGFDAIDLTFNSVTLGPDAKRVKFRTANGKVDVDLDRPYNANESVTLTFKHTAVPRKGVYFVDPESENGKEIHSAQIWTQGEADEARHWFPSFDFPSDKATTDQYITATADETVVSNGELVEKTTNTDGSVTHHYRMTVPTPVYLISFIIGKYVRISDKYGDIPLGFYVYPGSEPIGQKAFGDTKEMIRVFESLTGVKYPFNKYDQTIVSGSNFGGMENITATTMSDTDIFSVNNPLFEATVGDLVSHELAHSWFGNLVTCRNWAELWLNEGFATFMEAAFREKAYGRRNYIAKVMFDAREFMVDDTVNRRRTALFNYNADNVGELFERPATNYNKGGAVLHTLREEIGDEAFWKGVNVYLNRHRFGGVESTDLLAAMEEASNRDLKWFFDQWVYRGGFPKLDVKEVWLPASSTLKLTVTQTQKGDVLTPAAFRLPLDVEFTIGEDKKTEKVNITKRVETFSFKLASRPTAVKLDPLEKIPIKAVKTGTTHD